MMTKTTLLNQTPSLVSSQSLMQTINDNDDLSVNNSNINASTTASSSSNNNNELYKVFQLSQSQQQGSINSHINNNLNSTHICAANIRR